MHQYTHSMKFDLILTNPPFQDSTLRKKTPHKLWIDFTKKAFKDWLAPDGFLHQVSPSSFQSPSSKILQLFKEYNCIYIDLRTSQYFPDIASSFAHYLVQNIKINKESTKIIMADSDMLITLDSNVFYLPNDLCKHSFSVHNKFIFNTTSKLNVKWDYVTCHNILLRTSNTLSKDKTKKHIHPVFHTNSQIWWSSVTQDFTSKKKVMWTRSGYFKPFYDDGVYGGTDMAYYVPVDSKRKGQMLAHNLNLMLPQYILRTAKWSGFGNERVFSSIPNLPNKFLTDEEIFALFSLSLEEVTYVRKFMESGGR